MTSSYKCPFQVWFKNRRAKLKRQVVPDCWSQGSSPVGSPDESHRAGSSPGSVQSHDHHCDVIPVTPVINIIPATRRSSTDDAMPIPYHDVSSSAAPELVPQIAPYVQTLDQYAANPNHYTEEYTHQDYTHTQVQQQHSVHTEEQLPKTNVDSGDVAMESDHEHSYVYRLVERYQLHGGNWVVIDVLLL